MPRIIDSNQVREQARPVEALGPRFIQTTGLAGLILVVATFFLSLFLANGLKQFMFSYLANFCFFLSLSLGALFFVSLQHLTRAGWSVVVRRIAEYLAANVAVLAILVIPVILGMSQLYPWTDANLVESDPLLQWKHPFLNVPFFLLRCLLYFSIWWALSRFYLDRSLKQDESGAVDLTLRMEKWSAPGMALLGLTLTFASIDFIMSLTPSWYSTIFGVYFFSGAVVSCFAVLTVILVILQSMGRLDGVVTAEHYHDLGKFLFGFIIFWAYIAFSQYMLIWYSNLPEETEWIFHRQQGTWVYLSIFLVFGHFILPFFGLVSRHIKRNKRMLVFWAAWVLVAHWVDIYWLVMPAFNAEKVPFHLFDLLLLVGMGCIYVASMGYLAQGRALIPLRDPRLNDSLTFQNF